jgi:hypothetical protein
MLDIVSILLVMQLFSIPIRYGLIPETLSSYSSNISVKNRAVFFFTTLNNSFFLPPSSYLDQYRLCFSLLGEPLKNNVKIIKNSQRQRLSQANALDDQLVSRRGKSILPGLPVSPIWSGTSYSCPPAAKLNGMATSVFLEGKLTLAQQ